MSYNEKSMNNLVPFKKGDDIRRQNGRKKGSFNQRTIIKQLLSEEVSPDQIFSASTRERLTCLKGRTYMEALAFTLINQSLDGNTQASNVILRELRKVEEAEPKPMPWQDQHEIKITVVKARDEYEKLAAIEQRLEQKYGDNYECYADGEVIEDN